MTSTRLPKLESLARRNTSKDWALWYLLIITVSLPSHGASAAVSKPAPCWQIQLTEQIYTSSHQSIPSSLVQCLLGEQRVDLPDISQGPGQHAGGICEGKPLALMSPQISQLDTVKQGLEGNWVDWSKRDASEILWPCCQQTQIK